MTAVSKIAHPLQEALVLARSKGTEMADRQEDSGQAHRDVVLLAFVSPEPTIEEEIRAAGFDVEWFERGSRRGYLLEPNTKKQGYARLCAVLEMRDAIRAAGYGADILHREVA